MVCLGWLLGGFDMGFPLGNYRNDLYLLESERK